MAKVLKGIMVMLMLVLIVGAGSKDPDLNLEPVCDHTYCSTALFPQRRRSRRHAFRLYPLSDRLRQDIGKFSVALNGFGLGRSFYQSTSNENTVRSLLRYWYKANAPRFIRYTRARYARYCAEQHPGIGWKACKDKLKNSKFKVGLLVFGTADAQEWVRKGRKASRSRINALINSMLGNVRGQVIMTSARRVIRALRKDVKVGLGVGLVRAPVRAAYVVMVARAYGDVSVGAQMEIFRKVQGDMNLRLANQLSALATKLKQHEKLLNGYCSQPKGKKPKKVKGKKGPAGIKIPYRGLDGKVVKGQFVYYQCKSPKQLSQTQAHLRETIRRQGKEIQGLKRNATVLALDPFVGWAVMGFLSENTIKSQFLKTTGMVMAGLRTHVLHPSIGLEFAFMVDPRSYSKGTYFLTTGKKNDGGEWTMGQLMRAKFYVSDLWTKDWGFAPGDHQFSIHIGGYILNDGFNTSRDAAGARTSAVTVGVEIKPLIHLAKNGGWEGFAAHITTGIELGVGQHCTTKCQEVQTLAWWIGFSQ